LQIERQAKLMRIGRVVGILVCLGLIGWVVGAVFGRDGVELLGIGLGGLLFNSFVFGKKK
jgi:hypothetical protein